MVVQTQLCFLLFGTCLVSLLLLLECRKLESYAFPVFSTKECPGNQAEWKNRSSDINCTESNGYMCLPNENFTELLEFCYIYPRIFVQKDLCLYLVKRFSRVNSYNCRKFTNGCPELGYFSSETYIHPSCMEIENGCFSAEPSCKRQPLQSNISIDVTTLAIILGVSIPFSLLCIPVVYVIRKKSLIRRIGCRIPMDMEMIESSSLLEKHEESRIESPIEKDQFYQWEQEDCSFISTKACKEVERIIKSRNLVIVAGHSGSGKSAIIQHIALKYREQGWTVRRVNKVIEILDVYTSSQFHENKTICVFNDPLGKESFDEILNNSLQTCEEHIRLYLKTAKLVMSCRNHIISDTRVTRYLVYHSNILNIDDNKYKLSLEEKRQILNKYTSNMNFSDKDRHKIVEVERYFPILCKLYSIKEEYKNKGIEFFTEPITLLKEEIQEFRKNDKGKYCALALLVFFNDGLCVSDLFKNEDNENKYKQMLKLCGLPKNTPPSTIGDSFYSMKDCFVKKIGDTYHFYDDFVMEVTTYVFGIDYPAETIKHADTGFLRKRVKLKNCDEHDDSFTIYISDRYIEKLGERLYTEMFGERLVDVVLNPCLRNKNVIKVLMQKMADNPKNLQMLLETKTLSIDKHKFDRTSKSILMSKLKFLELDGKVSPLFALIASCHTLLSQYCLQNLQKMNTEFISCFYALCCNGSKELFSTDFNDHVEECLKRTWGCFYPIHIVSVFHNYDLLNKLIKIGVQVNQKTDDSSGWTPLALAAGNNTENGDYNHRESGAERRDKTLQLLLSNGADINLCHKKGVSPLFVACEYGHFSTVQLLLSNGADINLCEDDGASPLYVACEYGHDSIVQLLLRNRADIILRNKHGASPLFVACQNGHDSTVQVLLRKRADINLCEDDGASPLFVACQNGHDNTVQLLLRNRATINLCNKHGVSPLYVACQNGHTSTVQLLLSKRADIDLCEDDGASPLYVACQNGHDSTVQLLLGNRATINLCNKHGASPLYVACQNGHDSTVQLLLSNGADINLCKEYKVSPLYVAFEKRYNTIVNILIKYGAATSLIFGWRVNPDLVDCLDKHDRAVEYLLQKDNIENNMHDPDSFFFLFVSCQMEIVTRLNFDK